MHRLTSATLVIVFECRRDRFILWSFLYIYVTLSIALGYDVLLARGVSSDIIATSERIQVLQDCRRSSPPGLEMLGCSRTTVHLVSWQLFGCDGFAAFPATRG